ncbi:pyridoxamine 5'-phosphate oxidase family protein [Dactylosporangium fulvum]|uniref:Pyridoxamine 5'-phosphate oxidase family protein n=1 Tax=Dactylosporangium fulvum TaxID=53359 RepID=A0ABY5VVR4_9ACTN|nr:pyridoxamine 5'-phosphate oxidase family protein [Dactylosporangium fulvum]UWP81843.1 pyridoxamine 5'-phosphate oxidase family protein [Dactylosporangium fulvum]
MGAPVERIRVRRLPELAVTDPAVLRDILDAGMAGHVAIVHNGQPFAVPVAYGRSGDTVLFHGSTGSRLFRELAAGAPCCFSVMLLDGLVLARSAFETSMWYRSAMVLGRCEVVEDQVPALRAISEHILPGRWELVRPPSRKELAATLVLALPLTEWSVKVSAGPPESSPEDEGWSPPVGVVPLRTVRGALIEGEA